MGKRKHPLYEESNQLILGVVGDICSEIGSARALTVWLLFSSNEHNQLVDLVCDPNHYLDAHSFGDDYLVTQLLSKYQGLNLGIDTKQVALQTFYDCEEQCRHTNDRIRRKAFTGVISEILERSRKNCAFVLGPLYDSPSYELNQFTGEVRETSVIEKIILGCGWGSGVTSSVKGSSLSGYNKLRGNLECTADLIAAGGHQLVNSIPMWAVEHGSGTPDYLTSVTPHALTSVPGNAVTFVPKNAKTDRPIAIEPHLNAFLQRGIGKYLRTRLREKAAINLRSQARNQGLARRASVDGSLATVDLKSASDTVSRELIEFLLPREWVRLLGTARSHQYRVDQGWKPYHKWSSMGNGYTFELETLVFWSLAVSVCDQMGLPRTDVSVYGDDIIVPVKAFALLKEVLNVCGFTTNEKKTFSSGPFRESCGSDFYSGVPVRPFYIREIPLHLNQRFLLGNSIRRYSLLRCAGMGCDARFKRAWTRVFLSVKPCKRFRIPDGVGDGGFIGNFDESAGSLGSIGTWFLRRRHPNRGEARYRIRTYNFRPRKRRKDEAAVMVASALWQYLDSSSSPDIRPELLISGEYYTLREQGSWYEGSMWLSTWPSLGGWM